MYTYFIEHRGGRIHCLQLGVGERLLVALHGFGDRARLFAVLEKALSEHYTVVAFDLPFHGQTVWPRATFDKSDLLAVVEQIRQRLGCERLSLMGFSFGARLALAMVPDLLPRLERLFLLAPDGIRTQGMGLAVRVPLWLRRWLARVAEHPAPILRLVVWGHRLGLLPPLVASFLRFHLARPERRQRVFGCWLALDSFYLRRRGTRAIWEQSGLPVDIFVGTEDDIVHRKTLRHLAQGLPNVRVFQLHGGHRIVSEVLAEQLKRLLAGQ
ncbi:MAG: alpha/beta fold hydrolase [Saprospiraceae bacterium]|nr:alpha/beta hydrolase [Saprospiraceae bacterium]MDW8229129.1 alpha/beta fold hydrolase [Saprospiraceae bacterium]